MEKNRKKVKIKTTTGISIEFTPWTDSNKFKITRLHLYEEIGGKIGTGEIDLIHEGKDESLKMITEVNSGTVVISSDRPGGLTYTIPVFITSRRQLKYGVTLGLICTSDINFATKRITETYDDIEAAISLTYKDNKDIRTKPDSSTLNKKEYQQCQTNLEFCSKMCKSYKQDTIFAFGWEGLLIKDLIGIDSFGNKEPNIVIEDGEKMTAQSCQNFTYDNNLLEDPINVFENTNENLLTKSDFTNSEPANVTALICKDEYHIVGKDYYSHLNNLRINNKIYSSDLYSSFKIKGVDMPNYKLGDVVIYHKSDKEDKIKNPYKTYLVKSNEFFYSNEDSPVVDNDGLKLSWTTLLIGLEKGDWSENETTAE